MVVLVTGAKGFIGSHFCQACARKGIKAIPLDVDSPEGTLERGVSEADAIIHLAGINRPLSVEEFYDGNANFTKKVVDAVIASGKKTPILLSSSIQAALDNDYGKSKKMAEDYLFASGLPAYVYRLSNVFGRGCRPNYNSAAATFCYNIAHGLPVYVRDPECVVHYQYVDDIVDEWVEWLLAPDKPGKKEILEIAKTHDCSLGRLVSLLSDFKEAIESSAHLPRIDGEFERKLFKTFLYYASDEGSSFRFAEDERGYFEELYKSARFGQISENMSFPGICKGGHYHTYKTEAFYTVEGQCLVRQRNLEDGEILSRKVEGRKDGLVWIRPGWTHEIQNVGSTNSYTFMWISEVYDPSTADTYRAPVDGE